MAGAASQQSDTLRPIYFAAIGIVWCTIVLIIYHCVRSGWCSHQETGIRRRNGFPGHEQDEENPSSMEHSRVHLIPIYRYNKEVKMESRTEDATCAVCLCEFKEGEEVRILPDCKHSFHVPCIDMWLFSHTNCPICRTETFSFSSHPDSESLHSAI